MITRILPGLGLGAMLILAACAPTSSPPATSEAEPVGLQMVRTEAQLKDYPFFTLLSFEHDVDLVFVQSQSGAVRLSSKAHTGLGSLELVPGTQSVSIKLASLHSNRPWPGPWTLVGAYFYAEQPQVMTIAYDVNGQTPASYTVQVPAGRWTPVLLDTHPLTRSPGDQRIGSLRFTFAGGLSAPVLCDDVLEINNRTVHVGGGREQPAGWRVEEEGFRFMVSGPSFSYEMDSPEASADGWRLEEVNAIRARFVSRAKKMRTIYSDGREIIDSKCRLPEGSPLAAGAIVQQHVTPATIGISAEMGRVERNTPGDANNDGYSEATGTYQVVATTGRLEMVITPRTPKLTNAVLEIAGLPQGKVLATMEGRLIENVVRLPNGHVLLELSGNIDRPVMVNVKVSQ